MARRKSTSAEAGKRAKGRSRGKAKRGKSKPARARRTFLRATAYWLLVLFLWTGILGAGAGAYIVLTIAESNLYSLPQKERGIVVLAANGEVLAKRGAFLGDRVRLDELPPYIEQAVTATEDRRFRDHFGIDIFGLVRATVENIKAGRVVQGGSTITQQLAKNLFLKPERTFKRKLHEAVIALWLEHKYSKDEILQLYLNRVYFGGGAHGVEAASQRFFGKSARDVTLSEAAVLAGVLKAPSHYAPTSSRKRAEARAFVVLNAMVDAGVITKEQGQRAVDNPAAVTDKSLVSARPYITDWISELVPGYAGAANTNLVVETTIDIEAQNLAEKTVRDRLRRHGAKLGVSQAAFLLMTPDGAIRAMVGGRSYAKSQFNRAVKARRQPGSAFKPFVFLTALERGYSPDTVVTDAPFSYKNWHPGNYKDKYYGEVTLRQALARSLNSVAARLVVALGPGEVAQRARRLGIRSELTANPSLALGTSDVGLIELASAYAPFANGGLGVVPHVIKRITTLSGKLVYERVGGGTGRVVSATHVRDMNDMMSAVVREGTGRRAALDPHPVAGKTGTSQDFRDAWFVGYTASYVAVVWTGNDNGAPTKKVTGGGLPATIWHDVMAVMHAGLSPAALPGAGETHGRSRNIVDLLRDLSVAALRDFIGTDDPAAQTPEADRDIGSVIDEITDNPR